MTKIPYPDPASLDERTRTLIEALPPLNLIKVMAHAAGSVESVVRLSDSVLNRAEIDPVLRQVALIRLCVVMGSDYERLQIESVSRGYGMDDDLIAAARIGSTHEALSEDHRMAAKLAEELAVDVRPSPAVYDYFSTHLPVRQFVELVQSIGFYLMQARLIETFEVSIEDPPIDLSRRLENTDPEHLQKWRTGDV